MIIFDDIELGVKIADALEVPFDPRYTTTIARVGPLGRLIAGVLYSDYNKATCSAHIVGFGKNWLSRDLLWIMFDYPFNQLGCKKVFGQVPSDNETALRFDYKLGFKYVTTVPEVFESGHHLLILEMKREDCRWLSVKPHNLDGFESYGQEKRA